MVTVITETKTQCTCDVCRKSWKTRTDKLPGRCRWCGKRTWNGQDLRPRRLLTALGKTQHLSAWAKETGIGKGTILARLKLGWSDEKAVTTSVGKGKGKHDGNS